MAACKYCGKSAGMFSHSHKECEEKHNQGITIMEGAMRSYFRNTTQIGEFKKVVANVSQTFFVSSEDISCSSGKCIDEWTNTIHWPFHSTQLARVKEFLDNVGVSYQGINSSGALDRLCQKMLRGFMAEYFTNQKTLQRAIQISQQVMNTLPISRQQEQDAYYEMLGQAGKNFLKDGYLTSAEQHKVDE